MLIPLDNYIDVHTHHPTHEKGTISVKNVFAQNYSPDIKGYMTVGIHPWHLNEIDINFAFDKLQHAALNQYVIAIGEIGLDKGKNEIDYDLQKNVFLSQIKLAMDCDKAVIIHCVKAYSEMLFVKARMKKMKPWVFHGYNSSFEMAQQFKDLNCYFSFGEDLLKNNPKTEKLFKTISDEWILLETDDSDVNITEIYRKAAKIRNIKEDQLKSIISKNFIRCFK